MLSRAFRLLLAIWLPAVSLLPVSLAYGAQPDSVVRPDSAARPNILLVMSDDHAAAAIGAYGGKLSALNLTPNIDALVSAGMRFTHCFVTNSICTPSRAAILTGQYAHVNGVKTFVPIDPERLTLAKLLQKGGYHTAVIGKWHLHSMPVGFDYFSILPGQGRYHDPQFVEQGAASPDGMVRSAARTSYRGHVSDVITDKVLAYLKEIRPADKPFFLMYHFKAPHDMWEYARRFEQKYADVQIPEPDTLLDDFANRSSALRRTTQRLDNGKHVVYPQQTRGLSGAPLIRARYQEYMKRYLRCVAGVDENLGRVLDYLDESGLADNTIVVYTADQGFFLGEHGLYDKRFMYEPSLRMPLLIRWPGRIEPGSSNDDLVLNVDFAPTLLAAASLEAPDTMQGRSFLPLLQGRQPDDWRDAIYYRYYFSHFQTEPHYGVRTQQYKLIYFHRLDEWELFDLNSDPREMQSVYGEAAYAPQVKHLKATLARLRRELGDDER